MDYAIAIVESSLPDMTKTRTMRAKAIEIRDTISRMRDGGFFAESPSSLISVPSFRA
jgi:hypothetical protein